MSEQGTEQEDKTGGEAEAVTKGGGILDVESTGAEKVGGRGVDVAVEGKGASPKASVRYLSYCSL